MISKLQFLASVCFFIIQGHHQEIWCLAVSPSGDYVVSASHDKSLRLWERTREPLILEEEREMVRPLSLFSGLVGVAYRLSLLKIPVQCSHTHTRGVYKARASRSRSQVDTGAVGVLML